MRGLGTVVNVITVLAGTGVGVLLHGRMPERVRTTVLDGIGLIVLGVGIASFLETRNAVFPVDAIVAGGRRNPDRPTDRPLLRRRHPGGQPHVRDRGDDDRRLVPAFAIAPALVAIFAT